MTCQIEQAKAPTAPHYVKRTGEVVQGMRLVRRHLLGSNMPVCLSEISLISASFQVSDQAAPNGFSVLFRGKTPQLRKMRTLAVQFFSGRQFRSSERPAERDPECSRPQGRDLLRKADREGIAKRKAIAAPIKHIAKRQ